jgi:hypothetical protein
MTTSQTSDFYSSFLSKKRTKKGNTDSGIHQPSFVCGKKNRVTLYTQMGEEKRPSPAHDKKRGISRETCSPSHQIKS